MLTNRGRLIGCVVGIAGCLILGFLMVIGEIANCDFLNDYGGCDCPHYDKWYSCPIENKKPENIKAIKEYAEWVSKRRSEG